MTRMPASWRIWSASALVGPLAPSQMILALICAAFFVVIANLVVDVVYAALDPRVRYT